MVSSVAIVGLGLIGGSIARMIKKKYPSTVVNAYGKNPRTLYPAVEEGFIDNVYDMHQLYSKENTSDIIIVATPVIASIDIITSILDQKHLTSHTRIIDVGSVKKSIIEAIIDHPKAHQFVACHPMAGSEKTGFSNSSHTLLANAWVIITPHEKNRDDDIVKIKEFWQQLECKIYVCDAAVHDYIVACSSHLPHVTSTILLDCFHSCVQNYADNITPFIGRGFKDMTRIAGGNPEMWADIVLLNSANILYALQCLKENVVRLKDVIEYATLHNDRKVLLEYFNDVVEKWNIYNG